MKSGAPKLAALLALALAACAPFGGDSGSTPDDDTATVPKKHKTDDSDSTDATSTESPDTTSAGDAVDPAIDAFFASTMKAGDIPGLSVAVVGDGHVKWSKGYGVADLTTKTPVTKDTLFMLGGTAIAMTATALMQLIEDPANGITLDTDVSTKLGFSVRNPSATGTPITFRMLLTQTASFGDEETAPPSNGDSSIGLESFVRSEIAKSSNWSKVKPGTRWHYSNLGMALVGLAVEKISGKNLQEYSKARMFQPLGMNESSFFLRDLEPKHIAQPYDVLAQSPEPQGLYGYPDYPSGQLRSSARQMGSFLLMVAQGGSVGTTTVLSEQGIRSMIAPQTTTSEGQGFAFFADQRGGRAVVGVDGADSGVRTEMFIEPTSKAGYVLLMNANANEKPAFDAARSKLSDKLMELAVTLP